MKSSITNCGIIYFCLPCAVHFCSYKEKFISLYCRLSSVLDLDALITQQAFREAITDSEVSTAKQRHQHILDYIQVCSVKGNVICIFFPLSLAPNYTINNKRFLQYSILLNSDGANFYFFTVEYCIKAWTCKINNLTPYANAFNIAVFFDDTEINTCSFILFLLCPKVYDKQKDSSLKMIF